MTRYSALVLVAVIVFGILFRGRVSTWFGQAKGPLLLRFYETDVLIAQTRYRYRRYATCKNVDLSYESRSLASCLHGSSMNDNDLYVMLNAYWLPMEFNIQRVQPEIGRKLWIRTSTVLMTFATLTRFRTLPRGLRSAASLRRSPSPNLVEWDKSRK